MSVSTATKIVKPVKVVKFVRGVKFFIKLVPVRTSKVVRAARTVIVSAYQYVEKRWLCDH